MGVHAKAEYPIFYKLFQRAAAYQRRELKITCRQVTQTLWLLIPRGANESRPDSLIDGAWRKHGRYKFTAQQLERGEVVTLDDAAEARKVRRAWMLYVPRELRQARHCWIYLGGSKYLLKVQ